MQQCRAGEIGFVLVMVETRMRRRSMSQARELHRNVEQTPKRSDGRVLLPKQTLFKESSLRVGGMEAIWLSRDARQESKAWW